MQKTLTAVRPYIKYFHSSSYINDIANGEICLAIGWNGDFGIAQSRADEAKNGVKIQYVIPKEGALLWVDNLAMPKDAVNVAQGLAYINNMLDPQVAADNANFVHYATPNKAALDKGLIAAEDKSNPAIYPPADVMGKLAGDKVASPELDQTPDPHLDDGQDRPVSACFDLEGIEPRVQPLGAGFSFGTSLLRRD